MKKLSGLLFVLSLALIMPGCGKVSAPKVIIDCYSISLKDAGSSSSYFYSSTYQKGSVGVYEYINEKGEELYFGEGYSSISIRYYENEYSSEFSTYTYSRLVGYLTYEQKYFLDLENKTIIEQLKFSEYEYDTNPSDVEVDNKEAFRCASKGCFTKLYSSIYKGKKQTGLERNKYIYFGDSVIVSYTEKWF